MLTFENITTITPSELSDPPPGYEFHIYEDTAPFPHSLPPISVEIPVATSSMNTRGPPSSVTTPHTPGLISPSQAAYASSPSQLAVTPPTPAQSLDVYSQYTHSAPVSPYLTQPPPWHTSHHVRVFHPFCIRHSNQSSIIATISGTRPSIRRPPTGSHGATEALQASHFQ